MEHRLKSWPEYFRAVASGLKRFELRLDYRPFEIGDTLILEEWNPATAEYTGNVEVLRVTYLMTHDPTVPFSPSPGWIIMSLETR